MPAREVDSTWTLARTHGCWWRAHRGRWAGSWPTCSASAAPGWSPRAATPTAPPPSPRGSGPSRCSSTPSTPTPAATRCTAAAEQLGGLDALVVCVGVAGFGPAVEADDAVVEELFAVDVLGPMALVRAAAAAMGERGRSSSLSAILADLPTARMAEYSAAKSALATWLEVLRREERRRLTVVDVRPPHLDTGLDGGRWPGSRRGCRRRSPRPRSSPRSWGDGGSDRREVVFDDGALVVR